jgi:alkanesulfonate monooxygenase SsuD/methylene tetrahydromethanopterin reductase-like flavin-dependent oxidoreductase (luciferase family)
MRFGLTVPNFGAYYHPRTLAALAADAEAAGWDGFFIWDHVMFGSTPTADPWVALAAIALATERLRIGPMVTPLPRRRPAKLARETVSLDQLSNGRLVLGVGIGAGPWEWENLGEPSDLRTRAAMLDEGLDLLAELWSGQPVRHRGAHYMVDVPLPGADQPASFLPTPVQEPCIPIWVGGSWPHRGPFRRAARCDGVFPMKAGEGLSDSLTPQDLSEVVAFIAKHRTADGPFDVVACGDTSGSDHAADEQTIAAYRAAGATWWVENVSPWRFGWNWQGPWPEEAMFERIRRGPPGRET